MSDVSMPHRDHSHTPVMLNEAVDALLIGSSGTYLDGTFGGGGHARRILETGNPDARLVAVDADLDAVCRAEALKSELDDPARMVIIHSNLRDLERALDQRGIDRLDGALLDLGVSSYQLDTSERGFSFRHDAPLDMRFDQSSGASASTLLQSLAENEIADILFRYGDERRSRKIARDIVSARADRDAWTTKQLAELVEASIGRRPGSSIHPATRTFQALRIAVNDELAALSTALEAITSRLNPGARVVVIAFHSLEDRIVKRFMADAARDCICPPKQPICTCETVPRLKSIGKPRRASADEVDRNVRSRSSIMRIAEHV